MDQTVQNGVNINSVCRLCANIPESREANALGSGSPRARPLIPLFEGEGLENNLPDRISKYLDFSVHLTKGMPSSVCLQCTMSLLNWHRFYQNCEKINEQFRKMLILSRTKPISPPPPEDAAGNEQASQESGDDDDMGIDFDEDSSAFNKILKEVEMDNTTIELDTAEKSAIQEQKAAEQIVGRKGGRRKLPSEPKRRKTPATSHLPPSAAKPLQPTERKRAQRVGSSSAKPRKSHFCEGAEHSLSTKDSFNCPICDHSFNRKFNRDQHISSHTQDVPCRICAFSFRSENALQSHLVASHDAKQVKNYMANERATVNCSDCSKEFASHYALYFHTLAEHSTKDAVKCGKCTKFFTNAGQLQRHMKTTHAAKNDRKCSVCDKTFASKQALEHHLRIHTGSKPIECPHCSDRFRCPSLFRQHCIARQHGNVQHAMFMCALCSQTFTRSNRLRTHLQKLHFKKEEEVTTEPMLSPVRGPN